MSINVEESFPDLEEEHQQVYEWTKKPTDGHLVIATILVALAILAIVILIIGFGHILPPLPAP